MSSLPIVIYLYILKNSYFCLFSTREYFVSAALFFDCRPKTLDDSIIITVTFFTHTNINSMLKQLLLIAAAGVFTAAIGVMDQLSSWMSSNECQVKCCFHQFCIMMCTHRPANDFS